MNLSNQGTLLRNGALFSWKVINDTQALCSAFPLLIQLETSICFLKTLPQLPLPISFIAMETKRSSPAGGSAWLWTGSEKGDTPTSRFLSPSGGRSPLDKTVPLQVRHHPGRNLAAIGCRLQAGDVKRTV